MLFRVFALLALAGFGVTSGDEDSAQVPLSSSSQSGYVCEHPPYRVHVVSPSPLIIYISDFITKEERAHLQKIT
jgi:prolyl 4-hydroxylase